MDDKAEGVAVLELDVMSRLLVLEGVGDVEPYTWAGQPGGLRHVRAEFSDVSVEWLSSADTGMYGLLVSKASTMLRRSRVRHVSGEDLLQQALSGLCSDLTVGRHRFHAVGVLARENILGGIETPRTIASGVLGRWVERMAFNTAKAKRAAFSIDDIELESNEGVLPQRYEMLQPALDVDSVLYQALCSGDAVSERIVEVLEEAVYPKFRTETGLRLMGTWFGALRQGEVLSSSLDWGIRAGLLDDFPDPDTKKLYAVRVATWKALNKAVEIMQQTYQSSPEMQSLVEMRLGYEESLEYHPPHSPLATAV